MSPPVDDQDHLLLYPFFVFRLNENMEFPGMSGEDIEWLQDEFVRIIFKRVEESKGNRRVAKEDQGKASVFRCSSITTCV